MGFFDRTEEPEGAARGPEQDGLGTLLLQGEDMIDQLARTHRS
jgi:hypothetical protein